MIHHSAICVRDVEASLRFWRDGLGFEVTMDHRFEGDWPTLLHGPSRELRSVFLGDPGHPASGTVELVHLGDVDGPASGGGPAGAGFLLLSISATWSRPWPGWTAWASGDRPGASRPTAPPWRW